MSTCYNKPNYAFIYADTYEDAIYKAVEYPREYVDAMLKYHHVLMEDSDVVSAKIKPTNFMTRLAY